MKRFFLILLFIATAMFCVGSTVDAFELTKEPPIQLSEVEADGKSFKWDANAEGDLEGYILGYSFGGTEHVWDITKQIDLGNVTSIDFIDIPNEHFVLWAISGQTVWVVLYAYDTARNVSEASDSASTTFFVDTPPIAPQGLLKE